MSDSEDSTVTYTEISSPYEDLSDMTDDDDDDERRRTHSSCRPLQPLAIQLTRTHPSYRVTARIWGEVPYRPQRRHTCSIPEEVAERYCLPLRKRVVVLLPGPDTSRGEFRQRAAGTRLDLPQLGQTFMDFAKMLGMPLPGCQNVKRVRLRVTELATTVDQEDDIIYSQLDDARHDRALLRARVNMLYRDRPFHRRTALLMEEEARVSRAAWAQSMDACDQKMAPIRRTTRSTPVTTTPPPVADPTTTTSVTSAQLQAMIDQGVTAVLAARDTTQMAMKAIPREQCEKDVYPEETTKLKGMSWDARPDYSNKKRKFEDTSRNNQNQQQNKRQNTGRAYAAGNGDKKPYEGTKPLCPNHSKKDCPQWEEQEPEWQAIPRLMQWDSQGKT
ncbi:hypothetical protein Tco_0851650 [Tanacetum coccineum]